MTIGLSFPSRRPLGRGHPESEKLAWTGGEGQCPGLCGPPAPCCLLPTPLPHYYVNQTKERGAPTPTSEPFFSVAGTGASRLAQTQSRPQEPQPGEGIRVEDAV